MFKVYFLISLHLSLSINTFYSSKYNNKLFFVNSQKDFISLSLFNFEDIKIFSFFLYNQFSGFLFLFSLLLSFTLMAALYICLIFNTRKLS